MPDSSDSTLADLLGPDGANEVLLGRVEELMSDKRELRAEAERLKAQLEKPLTGDEVEVSKLRAEIRSLTAENRELRIDRDGFKKWWEDLQKQVRTCSAAAGELEQCAKTIEKLRAGNASRGNEFHALEADLREPAEAYAEIERLIAQYQGVRACDLSHATCVEAVRALIAAKIPTPEPDDLRGRCIDCGDLKSRCECN